MTAVLFSTGSPVYAKNQVPYLFWGAGKEAKMGGYRTQKTGKETRKEGLQIFVTSSITTREFCIESDPL
jgi:hypothetical protein